MSTGLIDAFLPRAQATTDRSPTSDFWYGDVPRKGTAGQVVTPQTALTLAGCWAATNCLAGLFGMLPAKSYIKKGNTRTEADKHDTYRVIGREPNPDMDSFVFWETMTQWWINWGNAFAEIQRFGDSGRIFALWPIHPSRVRPERDANKVWTGRWLVRGNDATYYPIDNADMFNIVGALSDDGLMGKGVYVYGAQVIGVGLAQEQYEADFYGNGGRPSGVLKHPKTLSEKARDILRREWKEVHGKSNEVAVLWEGMTWDPTSVDPQHAQLGQSKVGNVQDLCRLYDVPPHVLYDLSKGTFANTEEMGRFLVSQPFGKRLVRVEKAMDRQLFTDAEKKQGYYTKFNVDALLRGDPKQRAEVNQIKIRSGVLNQDEVRAQDELNPLPDGQGSTYWMSRDTAPMDLLLNPPEPPADPMPKTPPTPGTPPTPPTASAAEQDLANKLEDERATVAELRIELEREAASRREGEDVIATLRNDVAAVTAQLTEEKQASAQLAAQHTEATGRVDALQSEATAMDVAQAVLESRIAGLESQNTALEASQTALQRERDDLTARLTAETTRVVSLIEEQTHATTQIESFTVKVKECTAQVEAAAQQHNDLKAQLETAKTTAEQAKADQKVAETALAEANRRGAEAERLYEQRTDKATGMIDALTAARDELRGELGTLRAERDATQTQATLLAKSRDEALLAVTEAKAATETVKNELLATKNAHSEALSTARQAIEASLRAILDESLSALLDDERKEITAAARKPDQFKQIINGYYHSLGERITAQVSSAAVALEKLGAKRVDAAKIVSSYVSESRSKLNQVHHACSREDLRMKVREEIDTWENRRGSLLNWIGEQS